MAYDWTSGWGANNPYYNDPFSGSSPYGPGMPGSTPGSWETYDYTAPGYGGSSLPSSDDPWWRDALDWLWDTGRDIFGGGRAVAEKEDYFRAALAGNILCSGPFTVDQVYRMLSEAPPSEVQRVRNVLVNASAGWGNEYPPQNLRELAGALVAEAHGGRYCTPGDSRHRPVAEAIQSLAQYLPGNTAGAGGSGGGYTGDGGGGALDRWLPIAAIGAAVTKAAGLW